MHTLATLSLIAGISALTVPRSTRSFGLTASGEESGTIGQLSDGQNRIGGGLVPATFTISNGGISDAAGRGCILTPSVEQFQCDQGVGPTYGFAIASNGSVTSNGSSLFYACPASDTEWNLYTTPVIGQNKCVEIVLTASGCGAESSSSSATPQAVTTVTVYDCALASSTPLAIAKSSAAVESTSPAITGSTSEGTVPSSETAPIIGSTSPATLEVSSFTVASSIPATTIEGTSSIKPSTTPAMVIDSSSLAPVVKSFSASLATSYYSHSIISPSSVSGTPTTSIIVTNTTPTNTIYPTTAPSGIATMPSSYIASSVASYMASSVSSSSSCVATTLTGTAESGNYQYPHLIIPVSTTSPDTAYGTQHFGKISSNTSTIFDFDIPPSYSGSTCNLIFLFPLQSELETSSYTFSGTGEIEFEELSSAASSVTTYDNAPSVESVLGTFTVTEGSSTLISTFSCPAGETLTYELKALQDTYLYYFQDWNPNPIGLFVTYC